MEDDVNIERALSYPFTERNAFIWEFSIDIARATGRKLTYSIYQLNQGADTIRDHTLPTHLFHLPNETMHLLVLLLG